MSAQEKFMCPVCGYKNLDEPPRSPEGYPSYEVCECCGFEFGVQDDDRGYTYRSFRLEWLRRGSPWHHGEKPVNWDLAAQLKNLQDE